MAPTFSLGRTVRLTVRVTPEGADRRAYAAEQRRASPTDASEQLLMALPEPVRAARADTMVHAPAKASGA